MTQSNYIRNKTAPQIQSKGFELDRLPGDVVNMPHTFEQIKINVNDYVLSETINYSLEKLYDNWLYLISYSYIGSNDIPNTKNIIPAILVDQDTTVFPGMDGIQSFHYTFYPQVSAAAKNDSSLFTGVKNFIKIGNIADPDNYNVILTTSTNVILLSGEGGYNTGKGYNPNKPFEIIRHPATNVESNNDITHPSSEILFENITDLVVTDSNYLFIMDSALKSIFKFDISGITTLDPAVLKNDTPGRLMIKMIGGDGTIDDKSKFKENISFCTNDNMLYVIDRDVTATNPAATIKVYDSDLNWQQTVNITSSINSIPIDITYNPGTDRYYVLCHDWSSNDFELGIPEEMNISSELLVLDNELNVIDTYVLFDFERLSPSIGAEKHKRIIFSKENTNIMYLLTNKNVYKKYISRPTELVGRFKLQQKEIGPNNIDDLNFQSIDIVETFITGVQEIDGVYTGYNIPKDEITIFDGNNNVFYVFKEDGQFERALENEFDSTSISFDDIRVESDEFVNAIVYNKAIVKTLYNNLLLLENMSRRFSTFFSDKGHPEYVGFNYLREEELRQLIYDATLDNYIGINEVVLSATINRCLKKIYDLQLRIQKILQEKKLNVFPLLDQTVDLTI